MARGVDQASTADCLLQADCCVRRMPLRMAAIDDKAVVQTRGLIATKLTSDGGGPLIWWSTEMQRNRIMRSNPLLLLFQFRPITIGRKNWLFAGPLRAGQRAAGTMSLIQSAKLNGYDPYANLKDVLQRLPTHKNHLIAELLPHRWQPLHIWPHLSNTC